MKKWIAGLSIASALVLAACGGSEESSSGEETPQSLIPVEATFLTEGTAEPGEEVTLDVEVMQGDDPVDDANEVLYEVWKANDKEHSEMIDSTNDGEGRYSATYTVEEEALYYVQVHVTARDTHVMPRMELVAGNPDMSAVEEEEDHDHDMEEGHDDHDHGDHEEHEDGEDHSH